MTERNAYIVAAVRTPIGIGKPEKGALAPVAPVDLAAHVLKAPNCLNTFNTTRVMPNFLSMGCHASVFTPSAIGAGR